MKRLLIIVFLSCLVACDSKPDGFTEYGFYMRDGTEVTQLFNTKKTYAVTLNDAATKTVEFKPGAELLIYMPGFNERKILIYKARPWTLYPRDTHSFVRYGDENIQIKTERVDKNVHRISGENIPDANMIGLSYIHGVDNYLFSGFVFGSYEAAVRDVLKKRSNWGKEKSKFAKNILEGDFLESTKVEAKRVLSKDKSNKEKRVVREVRDKERYASNLPVRKKVDLPSEDKLKNGAVNRKQYTLAQEYVTGRELSNLIRYKGKETVLQPKRYTHSSIHSTTATLYVNEGQASVFKKDSFGWKISQF